MMNPYAEAAANKANVALEINDPKRRAELLAEAADLAQVAMAYDSSVSTELAVHRDLESVKARYELVPADGSVDLSALSDDTRQVVEAIVQAETDESLTVGAVLFDTRPGPLFDAERIRAASLVLGLGPTSEERLGAWYGAEREDWVDEDPGDVTDGQFDTPLDVEATIEDDAEQAADEFVDLQAPSEPEPEVEPIPDPFAEARELDQAKPHKGKKHGKKGGE